MLGVTATVEWKAQRIDNIVVSQEHLQPIRFQGLHYNRFRYFDPDLGMFTTRDPIGLLGGSNVFQYAPNPTGWIDPFGLSEEYTGTVYRGMKVDSAGNPVVHSGSNVDGKNAANSLGIRADEAGMSGSVSPKELPPHRRPSDFGGTQSNAKVFSIDTATLESADLKAVNDHGGHISIEPRNPGASRGAFIEALESTKNKWTPCAGN